jgi:hypothetical protein
MTLELLQVLKKAADELDLDAEVHDCYQSSSMAPPERGIALESHRVVFHVLFYAGALLTKEETTTTKLALAEQCGKLRMNNLGHDVIVY